MKKKLIEVTPDGHQTPVPGVEPLRKKPKGMAKGEGKKDKKKAKFFSPASLIQNGLAAGEPDSKFDTEQLDAGKKIELEHTKDKGVAKQIAKDHLKEIPDYYTRLKAMEAQAKDDEKKGEDDDEMQMSMKVRWESLKKKMKRLSHEKSIPPLDGASPAQEAPATPEAQSAPEAPEGIAAPDMPAEQDPQALAPEESTEQPRHQKLAGVEKMMVEAGYPQSVINYVLHGHVPPEGMDQESAPSGEEGVQPHEADQVLKEVSDEPEAASEAPAESSGMPQDEPKDEAPEAEAPPAAEEDPMKTQEMAHQKRMQDLEYDYKKQENELKLKLLKQKLSKSSDPDEDDDQKKLRAEIMRDGLEREAQRGHAIYGGEGIDVSDAAGEDPATPALKALQAQQKKDRAKKSEDDNLLKEEDILDKAAGWSYNPQTANFSHPSHGALMIKPAQGGFQVVHNAKVVGLHPTKQTALGTASSYMKDLGKPVKVKG